MRALRLVRPAWLQPLHAVGLVVEDEVLFFLFGRRLLGGSQLLTQDGVKVGLDVVFGAKVLILFVVVLALGLASDGSTVDDRIRVFLLDDVGNLRVDEEILVLYVEFEGVFVERIAFEIWIREDLAFEFSLVHHFVIRHSSYPFQQLRREISPRTTEIGESTLLATFLGPTLRFKALELRGFMGDMGHSGCQRTVTRHFGDLTMHLEGDTSV